MSQVPKSWRLTLAAATAILLAGRADASLTRSSASARETPTLALSLVAPERSEFSLFEGDELARALASRPALISISTDDESASPRTRFASSSDLSSDELPDLPELIPITAVREQRFHLELPRDVFGLEPLRGPPSGDEASYPKTRYRVFELLGSRIVGVERDVTLALDWGCADFSCELASGTVGWLSQDPMEDRDSPNLYGFVGARPHEKTDPLGLWGWKDIKKSAGAAWSEVKQAAGNFGEGALERASEVAEFVLNFGRPEIQIGIQESAKSVLRNAQDENLGPSPDQRLINAAAISLNDTKERFLNASKAEQQKMIGSAATDVVLTAAPFARARVPAVVDLVEGESAAARSVGAMARDPMSGPVEFEISPSWTPEQIQQARAAVESANRALQSGELSPTGRVSTKGMLRRDASRAAAEERARAAAAGQSYRGVAGHGPDTTWTGQPVPPEWQDMDFIVNSSIGAQARRYPIGYRPTEFILNEPLPAKP